jgi:hypothetical protein
MTASTIFVRRDSKIAGNGGRIDTRDLSFRLLDRVDASTPSTRSTYRPILRFRRVRKDGPVLPGAVADIEAHIQAGGWDAPPMLFALVRADRFVADDPDTAARLGFDRLAGDALAPVEQEALPDGPLDEVLGRIAWPESVLGCALSQEILVLPPGAEPQFGADVTDQEAAIRAAGHPDRREARLVVGVLRNGSSAALLRLRGPDGADDLLTGADLAPNLVDALLATFS